MVEATVWPRNAGQRPSSVVPLMKVTSKTTSINCAVAVAPMPTTVPRKAMGTLPVSAAYTTLSPSEKR